MEPRRLLLIDNDDDFHRLLYDQLGPYGFEVHVEDPDAKNPLGKVKEVDPEVILIAVELPHKVGYSLCNKAKKGMAKEIPVVLTTRTVTPAGFASHKKLKAHADEYIDKRDITPAS